MTKKNQKSTVTVILSWFSSDPVFADVLAAIEREMRKQEFLSKKAIASLDELRPLNDGQPFTGYTQFGPHTWINIETPSLARAVFVARVLEDFLWHEFSEKSPFFFGKHGTGGLGVSYAGKSLVQIIDSLETTLSDAQQDLKGTRRFLPSKRIQRLRLVHQELYR